MNTIFLSAGILTLLAVCLHIYTMEHWIYPKLKDDGFPATPFGDKVQTKRAYRMLWHFFTIAFFATAGTLFAFCYTDWFPDPKPMARLLSLQWFGYAFVAFCIAQFRPSQLAKAWQWTILLTIAILIWWGTV